MQERCNSIANALELRLSCPNPSKCFSHKGTTVGAGKLAVNFAFCFQMSCQLNVFTLPPGLTFVCIEASFCKCVYDFNHSNYLKLPSIGESIEEIKWDIIFSLRVQWLINFNWNLWRINHVNEQFCNWLFKQTWYVKCTGSVLLCHNWLSSVVGLHIIVLWCHMALWHYRSWSSLPSFFGQ